MNEEEDEAPRLSHCKSCNCMTRSIDGMHGTVFCGKCKAVKVGEKWGGDSAAKQESHF